MQRDSGNSSSSISVEWLSEQFIRLITENINHRFGEQIDEVCRQVEYVSERMNQLETEIENIKRRQEFQIPQSNWED